MNIDSKQYERRKVMEERVLDYTEKAYENMEKVAYILTALSPNGARYTVQNTWLDYGLKWEWTTIIRTRYNECQVLCPRDWKRIVSVENPRDLLPIVNDIINDKYYGDK